ncbi:MAG: PAS domain S-box protein [Candidatus Aenigmarchaeota archaeon]|nr:PAS domain S-box protein [Candidatus Aenigmarchaeota archaeon]
MESIKQELSKNSYSLLFDIFEKSPVAITAVNRDGCVIALNKFAEKIYGRTKKEMYGRSVASLYPKEEWKKIREEKIIKKLISPHFETKIIRKDGTIVEIDISIIVVKDKDGNVVYSIGVARDITGRKKMQRQLKEKIEDLEKFKDAVVDRELKMIELEDELDELKKKIRKK